MGDKFRCPRRHEMGIPLPEIGGGESDTPDSWRRGVGLINQTRGCSYCGSMSPEDFMQALRDGGEAGPTDKSYKVYLRTENGMEGKFYFQHLSVEQQQEFIDMLNAGTMAVGYPGYFYTRPFFIAPRTTV